MVAYWSLVWVCADVCDCVLGCMYDFSVCIDLYTCARCAYKYLHTGNQVDSRRGSSDMVEHHPSVSCFEPFFGRPMKQKDQDISPSASVVTTITVVSTTSDPHHSSLFYAWKWEIQNNKPP